MPRKNNVKRNGKGELTQVPEPRRKTHQACCVPRNVCQTTGVFGPITPLDKRCTRHKSHAQIAAQGRGLKRECAHAAPAHYSSSATVPPCSLTTASTRLSPKPFAARCGALASDGYNRCSTLHAGVFGIAGSIVQATSITGRSLAPGKAIKDNLGCPQGNVAHSVSSKFDIILPQQVLSPSNGQAARLGYKTLL